MPNELLFEERVSSSRTQALFWGLTVLFLVLSDWRVATNGSDALSLALILAFLVFLFYSLNYRTLLIRLTATSSGSSSASSATPSLSAISRSVASPIYPE